MKKIAFIGVGIMGKYMVQNLMKAGYEVSIYTRTKSKAKDVIKEGAIWHDTIAECVKNCEAVITMVGYPKDVEEVYFGETGILKSVREGTYVIDMTTTSPKLAIKIYEEAVQIGIHALDAPVTGGDTGAKNGTLSVLAGGNKEDFEACQSIFAAMGQTIVYQGKAGNGQHTKMANQIVIAGTLAGVCEAIRYAEEEGLDREAVFAAISKGAAGSSQMTNMAPKIFAEDFAPGFFAKHFIKDMKIAVEEAGEVSLDLGVLKQVLGMFEELEGDGKGDLGTQSLIQYYKK